MAGMDPISIGLDLGGKLIDRLFPDPAKKAEAALELLKLQQSGELTQIAGQMEINKIEAASPSLLVAGGRPAFIWMGVIIFGLNYVVGPLFTWVAALFKHPTPFPQLDVSQIMTIVMPVLGLGAYRTYEKVQGVVDKH